MPSQLEAARSAAYYASGRPRRRPRSCRSRAPLAEAVCGDALSHVAAEAIQMHGGIGFTWEHHAHLYFKRAKASELLAGGTAASAALVGERAGILG